jgi:InsA C-terminal domain
MASTSSGMARRLRASNAIAAGSAGGRGRTFLLEYAYAGQSPAIKEQIVDMAMNASGIRDTARVLHVSPTTVIKELKKRTLNSNK